jgi:hypothetical protein
MNDKSNEMISISKELGESTSSLYLETHPRVPDL